jgi:hypothetical protein
MQEIRDLAYTPDCPSDLRDHHPKSQPQKA